MEEVLMYCYEKLHEAGVPKLSEEEYVKSMDILEVFLVRYQCYLESINWDEKNKRFILMIHANEDPGMIVIDSKSINLEIQKSVQFSSKILFEKLKVAGDTFSGNYCDFVYNPSSVEIYTDDKRTMCLGKECNTDFNNNGIIADGKTINYVVNTNLEKLQEAYYSHTLSINEITDNFLIFDDLNIVKLSIHSECDDNGKTKKKIN